MKRKKINYRKIIDKNMGYPLRALKKLTIIKKR